MDGSFFWKKKEEAMKSLLLFEILPRAPKHNKENLVLTITYISSISIPCSGTDG